MAEIVAQDEERLFERALIRNLHEASRAILASRAQRGLEAAQSYHSVDFFLLAHWAFFNERIAYAAKLFDRHPHAASFWFLYNAAKSDIEDIIAQEHISVERLNDISQRVRLVRNKTHFHIDRVGVLDSKAVWAEADIEGSELDGAVSDAFSILQILHRHRHGREFDLPNYDGSDATRLILLAQQHGLIAK